MPDAVRAICVRRAALFERSEFQHASKWHSRQEKWSTRTRQEPGGRCQPLLRIPQAAVGGHLPFAGEPLALVRLISRVYCGEAASESERQAPEE